MRANATGVLRHFSIIREKVETKKETKIKTNDRERIDLIVFSLLRLKSDLFSRGH